MEVASTSTAESRLEAKGKVRVAITKLRSAQNEYDALQWQLDILRSLLEGKNEHVMLGEVLLANTEVDWSKHSYDILGARMLWKPKEAIILKNF
jgi:hypothetical protein